MICQEEKEQVDLDQQTKTYVKFAKISFDLHLILWYNKKGRERIDNHKRSDVNV